MHRRTPPLLVAVLGVVASCQTRAPQQSAGLKPLPHDEHSFSRPNEVRVRYAHLDLTLDFASKRIDGTATLAIDRLNPTAPLVVDTRNLEIRGVTGVDRSPRTFRLGPTDKLLGQALTIDLAAQDKVVTISYATRPESEAVQWLTKEQTYGKQGPYLYTQGQAILTRSWIPLQDTPGVRMTYSATVRAPEAMRAVMSANVRREKGGGVFEFAMEKPIPCYLIALACGHIGFAPISDRCGVFADPAYLEQAAKEFEDTEEMLQKCETAFGAYQWGRYDIIVLPPAFPFGGMENPTLTFATPTIITGDKSLVALIAHELAHSWSGNLVTNATWRDFWLNEGFTVFLEQRIMELVFGEERAALEIATGVQQLRAEIAELPAADQILHIDLTGRNPDDAMTAIAYDKGAAFLRRLEEVFGRETFKQFLNGYFAAHAFQSITTADFLAFLQRELLDRDPEKAAQVDVQTWVFGPGLPKTMPETKPAGFAEVDRARQGFVANPGPLSPSTGGRWNTHQWLHFLNGLPESRGPGEPGLTPAHAEALDGMGLLDHNNPEIRCVALTLVLRDGHLGYVPKAAAFLRVVGRRKFVTPIFKALVRTTAGKRYATALFEEIQAQLHFITRSSVAEILAE